ncbi:ABC transporter B family member 19-like protein [Drosera capensis]
MAEGNDGKKSIPEAEKKKEQTLPFYKWLMDLGKNQTDLATMTHDVKASQRIEEEIFGGSFETGHARTGDIVFSVSVDTLLVQDAISEKVGNFIHYLSTFLAGLVVGFVSAWRVALLSVAVIPGIAFAGGLYAYTITGLTSKSRESYANAGIIAEQAIAQVRTVYSYVGEMKALKSYSEAIQNTLQLGYKAGIAKGLGLGCTYGIACMSWALVFWCAGVFIRNGQTDRGKAFTAVVSAILGGIKGKAAGYKLMEIIQQKPTIVQDLPNGKCLDEVNGNIEFKNVCLDEVNGNIEFKNLERPLLSLAAVGHAKALLSLIERFYDPNQGTSAICDNILENILYGKPNASFAEVEAAASAANAHSFITLLSDGYNTQVGERGVQLSGGQKQRIAIARAMLKDLKILLLDEATSALDASSESIVQEALDRLMVGRTTVVVAHRLSTIRNVDTISVIQHGQVVEMGNHEELIAKPGAYASLIRFQEMVGHRDFSNPSARRLRSSWLSHSLSTKSPSLRSGSIKKLSYSYSTGADGRIKMISNADTDSKNRAPEGYFFRLLKLNAPEWPYSVMDAIGSILPGFIGSTFAIVMSNMIEVFYFKNYAAMERKTKEYVFVYIGAGLYAVVAYLIQRYFFSIMGENLTTSVRRMMLVGSSDLGSKHHCLLFATILRNEVGWFDEEEHNSSLLASWLATDTADVKSAVAERLSVMLQNMTFHLTSFINRMEGISSYPSHLPASRPCKFRSAALTEGFAGDTVKAHAKTSMIAGEGVSNIRMVAAFNGQEKILGLFCDELKEPQRRSLRRSQTAGSLFGLSQLALYLSEAVILWYGAYLVARGIFTFSQIIKVFVVLVITANSVAETVSLAPEIIRGGEAVASAFAILDRRTKIDADDLMVRQWKQSVAT